VTVSMQLAMTDPIQNTVSKTTQTPQVSPKEAVVPDTWNYTDHGGSVLDYTILAYHKPQISDFTLTLQPNDKTVLVPKRTHVAARTLAKIKIVRIAHVSAFSVVKDHVRYTEFGYAKALQTICSRIHPHRLPMVIDGRSGSCVFSEMVTGKSIIGCRCAD